MPAKRIAAMGRSYRYPQANRRNCPSVCCATALRRRRRAISYQTKNNPLFYMYKLNLNMNPVGASLLAIFADQSIVGVPNHSKN